MLFKLKTLFVFSFLTSAFLLFNLFAIQLPLSFDYDDDGSTVLHVIAIRNDQERLEEYLADARCTADFLNAQDIDGNTALHMAADKECKTICQMLLVKGAKVNIQNKDGDTPLHIAAKKINESLCKLLIENGADNTILNNNKFSPLDWSKFKESAKNRLLDLAAGGKPYG